MSCNIPTSETKGVAWTIPDFNNVTASLRLAPIQNTAPYSHHVRRRPRHKEAQKTLLSFCLNKLLSFKFHEAKNLLNVPYACPQTLPEDR